MKFPLKKYNYLINNVLKIYEHKKVNEFFNLIRFLKFRNLQQIQSLKTVSTLFWHQVDQIRLQ